MAEITEYDPIEGETDSIDQNEDVVPTRYDITSYGIDFDVDGLIRRINRNDIVVPDFQRSFVWTLTESSKFIESLLLGLPVPGIFLAHERKTNQMLVIDGQQRLLTLKYFREGLFHENPTTLSRNHFRLSKVQAQFDRKSFEDLSDADRINLENAVIHATVVKQDSPSNDDSSIYHIFERLNSGGRKLIPQEIRAVVYRGKFIKLIKKLNEHESWRKIFGQGKHRRQRDQELILRFLAMYYKSDEYSTPMTEFLNQFLNQNRNLPETRVREFERLFITVTDLFSDSVTKPFRLSRALNVAFFDAAMVGLARRVNSNGSPNSSEIESVHRRLLNDPNFFETINRATAEKSFVQKRIQIATEAFGQV